MTYKLSLSTLNLPLRKIIFPNKKNCKNCDKIFESSDNYWGRKRLYCDKKCKEDARGKKRRKNPNYKGYQRDYQKMWKEKNQEKWKKIKIKSESRPERKEYLKNWWKGPKAKEIIKRHNQTEKAKMTRKEWNKKNPDKIKSKYQKYSQKTKGIVNQIKKRERGKYGSTEDTATLIKLIDMANKRDKSCVYCGKNFPEKHDRKIIKYDHVDPLKPFSNINLPVRACKDCNYQKSSYDVKKWCEFKGYKAAKIIYQIIKKTKTR